MARNENWTPEEVSAVVADHLDMLRQELAGVPYSKAGHRRQLAARLDDRSGPSIEFKHANISAVLAERGLRYIAGYKPRGNYQRALSDELDRQLEVDPDLRARMRLQEAPVDVAATLSEDAVIAAVKRLLTGEGWSVVHVASAALKEKGVDLEARLGERRLIIEAKGWPASTYKDGTPKRWLPYPQARAYYSNALLPLLIGWSEVRAEIALALPEQPTNVRLVDRTARALRQLGIGVYFVYGKGRARRHIEHRSRE